MRVLSQELIMAQENERQRIARELHDHLAQDLSLARADLERVNCNLPDGGPWKGQTGAIAERLARPSAPSAIWPTGCCLRD
jgi:Signal transduction histidine kinase